MPTRSFVSYNDCFGSNAVYGVSSAASPGAMKAARRSVATRSKRLNGGKPSINSTVFTMLGWL